METDPNHDTIQSPLMQNVNVQRGGGGGGGGGKKLGRKIGKSQKKSLICRINLREIILMTY
jgi:hypothetical protein